LNGGNGTGLGAAIGAVFVALGMLILFAAGFAIFLEVPLLVVVLALGAMFISDRKRSSRKNDDKPASSDQTKDAGAAG
jgi:hypothetical protein